MPLDLLLLAAFSFVISRRARVRNRSRVFWVLLLWVSGISVGVIAAVGSVFAATRFGKAQFNNEAEVLQAMYFPMAIGLLVGIVIPLVVLGRLPHKQLSSDNQDRIPATT